MLAITSFAQYNIVSLYPSDSTYKHNLSFHNNDIYCLATPGPYMSDTQHYLYKSDDYGNSWTMLNYFEHTMNFIDFVSLNDSCHISIGKHQIERTSDCFDSVQYVMQNQQLYPTTIKIANDSTILIYNKGTVFSSHNQFTTWDTLTIQNGSVSKGSYASDDINIVNDSIWFIFMEYDQSIIKTSNAGQSWNIIKDFSSNNYYAPVFLIDFYSPNDGLIMIDDSLYITHNGASSLNKIFQLPNNIGFQEIKAFPNGTFLLLNLDATFPIQESALYLSKDFGNSWDTIKFQFTDNDGVVNLFPQSDSLIFATTFKGKLIKINLKTLSIQAIHLPNNDISVYPNPTSKLLNIENPNLKNGTFQIIDIQSKLIIKGRYTKPKFNINISNLKSGIYFIKVQDKNGDIVGSKKFIKI